MRLVVFATAWIGGILATDLLVLPDSFLWGVAVAGAAFSVLVWSAGLEWTRLAGLVLLVAALGGIRYESPQAARASATTWHLVNQGEVMVQGFVAEDPRWSEAGQRVVLTAEAARAVGASAVGAVRGDLLLVLPPYPVYHYGQRLIVQGSVREPPQARQPNAFDYRDYLARKRIFALMQGDSQVSLLPGTRGSPFLVALLRFRRFCHSIILRSLPEPQASVAAGMLLGLKATIPDTTYDSFSRNGISHILVISGWHLSLVASVATRMAQRLQLRRGATFWASVGVIWLYALFVGATGTVLRAAVMATLVVLAAATERQTEPWTLLLAACWFLTFWDPNILWDPGFQLSALATASLMAFSAPVRRWLARVPLLRWPVFAAIADTLAATLAAQILVLPLILYYFGNLSIISPLSNVLLVPVVPPIMMLSAVALGGSLVGSLVGSLANGMIWVGELVTFVVQWLWLMAWVPLAYLTGGAEKLAELPWASVPVPSFPLWLLLGYYLGVLIMIMMVGLRG
ncbi:MAG: ComEC family competence protein [Chloroflexaceae bacterium]|nr:ComEC family competence protein [Chloroflexaceae bacterium]